MSGYLMRRTPQKIARWWTRDYLPHDGTLQEQHRGKKGVGNIAREQYRQIFPFENLSEVIGA